MKETCRPVCSISLVTASVAHLPPPTRRNTSAFALYPVQCYSPIATDSARAHKRRTVPLLKACVPQVFSRQVDQEKLCKPEQRDFHHPSSCQRPGNPAGSFNDDCNEVLTDGIEFFVSVRSVVDRVLCGKSRVSLKKGRKKKRLEKKKFWCFRSYQGRDVHRWICFSSRGPDDTNRKE